jgi:hypothetical protein
MGSRSFLERAEDYAELRGDSDMFKEIYQQKREVFSVKESTWGALFALYGAKIADHLEVL